MEMLAIAINARKFLKELEETTPGRREETRPAPRQERRAGRRAAQLLGMVSRAVGALRCWLRCSRLRIAG